jgi:uncharacterized protein (DUF2062 family)
MEAEGAWQVVQEGGSLLGDQIIPLLLGTIIVGLCLGGFGYACIKPAVERLQRRRAERQRAWAQHAVRPQLSEPSEPSEPVSSN